MSQTGDVVMSYEEGKTAMKKGDFLTAARLFRICNYSYEYGELPFYMSIVQEYGCKAVSRYEECLEKLPKEQREQLKAEEKVYYDEGWRTGVRYDIEQLTGQKFPDNAK
ncbi:hypothetical protein C7Y71_011435 [Pseudoprevotella muciniphila]|uniref:Uncharacterized protein n=1 Tax=Pseudoprevotella muciniphila TaxID=2133944 RepID=A0A5P8E9J2_9BACT|nr:hypothetical protein [Pseudoprevotella muciniphila]QFQ13567.1 hypothetical protein C7Y71_011435 [Pseudoprevotella muciniphila]